MRRQPRGSDAEENAGEKRDEEGEPEHRQGGGGIDGHIAGLGEGEGEDGARSGIGNRQAGKPAEDAQEHALGKDLANNAAAARTQSHAHGHVGAPGGGAGQHQVGDVGAGDEQHDRREDHQHLQAVAHIALQLLDATAAGRDDHMHFGDDGRSTVCGKDRAREEPLTQCDGKFGLQRADVGSGADSAERIEPVGLGMMQDGAVSV